MHKILFLLLIFSFSGAFAEVLDKAAGGFTVEHRVSIAGSRDVAWAAFVNDVGSWWNGDHTVSGNAGNLYIEADPLGCFCEKLGATGGLVHLQVTFANPAVMLRLSGGLGPLGLIGVAGNMTVEFEDDTTATGLTLVTLRYAVGGYYAGGLDALAAPVDGVLGEQLARFAAFVNRVRPAQ